MHVSLDEALGHALRPLIADAVAAAVAELDLGARPEPREILTRREAADLLRVSLPQLDRLAEAGRIRRHYVAESPRFVRSELLEDLAGGRTSACPSR